MHRKATSVILAIMLLAMSQTHANEPVVIESAPGHVYFSHKSHDSVACLDCHHETTVVNKIAPCRQCHKKQAVGPLNAKRAFHKNCINCHAEIKNKNKTTGPVKLCSQCHKRK